MNITSINKIKISLLRFIDPYHRLVPSDKEELLEIIAYLTNLNIKRLPSDNIIFQTRLQEVPNLTKKVLFEMNTQMKDPSEDFDWQMILETPWIHSKDEYTNNIKNYIVNWIASVFKEFAAKSENELIKFYIDTILENYDQQKLKHYLDIIQNFKIDINSNLVEELYKICDVLHGKYNIKNRRIFIVEMGLSFDSSEKILTEVKELIKISLTKIYYFVPFNKDKYQSLYINPLKYFKNSIVINEKLPSKNNKLTEELSTDKRENDLFTLMTQAAKTGITINEFQKILLLIAHPQVIIDLRKHNENRENLFIILDQINHPAVKDIKEALYTKILNQYSIDESLNLFNKYFCFEWTLKTKDIYNFKRILPICYDIDLNMAEGKVFFSIINSFNQNEKYSFLKAIITDITERGAYYPLSYEILLHETCKSNFNDLTLLLLKEDIKVNYAFKEGITPLHIAAENGNLFIVRKLIERGALVHGKNHHGHTALYLATANGYLDVKDFLLTVK